MSAVKSRVFIKKQSVVSNQQSAVGSQHLLLTADCRLLTTLTQFRRSVARVFENRESLGKFPCGESRETKRA